MAYIGQGIKQGTFKVLDTSGNTYNGSNTTFSLGTQVGAAAQLLVSHDGVIQKAGTDYTLATGGTQITFSTAPASGASIFIIEISGAVGGTVTPSDNSVGVTQLNLSDGSNGQALTTNGSGTISFSTISTSLTGIDDQSSSNDDQLTITDTAVVINEDSDDVDFRVESNGNANMLFVSGGNDVVGIGAEGDLGVGLHIKTADTGATAQASADELVIENNGDAGITIATEAASNGNINFSDTGSNIAGRIQYQHNNNYMMFATDASERMRIPSDGGIFVNTTTRTGSSNVLSVLGTSTNDVMHVRTPSDSGAVNGIAFTDGDGTDCGEIVINPGGNTLSYNTSSDYRLKENVSYDFDATSRLKQLKPSRFNWISKPDTTVDGFLAHEVSSIVPEAITGTKDETKTVTNAVISKKNALITDGVTEAEWEQGKKDGIYPSDSTWSASKAIPKYQSIDQAKLVPLLTKALQEAQTRIEALEARVTTLEG